MKKTYKCPDIIIQTYLCTQNLALEWTMSTGVQDDVEGDADSMFG